ncbi:MAG TPA: flavin reductase family protein [Acidimicrobiia bacterium]|jgi:3-hydroxy-9,10-secoandrosta-1,3,5(10)-triene-9,17-dione monooxygenase reductase component
MRPEDPLSYRRVLGHFATGVTVVCGMVDGHPVGLTVNAFASVSLDPPMILFCPSRSSYTWQSVRATERFSVNFLGEDQGELCRRFSERGTDRFSQIPWEPSPAGLPILQGAIAWIQCLVSEVHQGGDHDVVTASVEALGLGPDETPGPLVFFKGSYHRLER